MRLSGIAICHNQISSSHWCEIDVCNHQDRYQFHQYIRIEYLLVYCQMKIKICSSHAICHFHVCVWFLRVDWWLYHHGLSSTNISMLIPNAIFENFIATEWAFAWIFICIFNLRHAFTYCIELAICYAFMQCDLFVHNKQAKSLTICCHTDLLILFYQFDGLNDLGFLTNLIAVAIPTYSFAKKLL